MGVRDVGTLESYFAKKYNAQGESMVKPYEDKGVPLEEIAGYIALVLIRGMMLVTTDSGCFGLAQVSVKISIRLWRLFIRFTTLYILLLLASNSKI
jgi:hypothetical protein